jgi:hypothetical protein
MEPQLALHNILQYPIKYYVKSYNQKEQYYIFNGEFSDYWFDYKQIKNALKLMQ